MKASSLRAPVLAMLLMAGEMHAAALATYSASASPSAAPDGNGGSVDVWTTSTTTGGSEAGFFLGNSASNGGAAGAGTSAWAVYAHSGKEAFASHSFAGALAAGQSVRLDFDNGFIDGGKSTGIQLFSGGTLMFQMYFRGGQSVYEYYDAGGFDQDTTAGFSRDGGIFSFTLTGTTRYAASFRDASWTGSLASTFTNPIDRIQVYNNSSGNGSDYNVFFNHLTVVPEPGQALAGGLLATALMWRRRPVAS